MTEDLDMTRPTQTRAEGIEAEFIVHRRNLFGDILQAVWMLKPKGHDEKLHQTHPTNGRVNGLLSEESPMDIVNAQQTREVWLPVFYQDAGTKNIRAGKPAHDIKPNSTHADEDFISWQGPFTITD